MAALFALMQGSTIHALSSTKAEWPEELFTVRDVSQIEGVMVGGTFSNTGTYTPPDLPAVTAPLLDVSSAQAKIQLLRASFLVPVKEAVAAIGGEAEIWFNDARTWQRNNPHVVEIGAGLALSDAEIDELFRAAALIDA